MDCLSSLASLLKFTLVCRGKGFDKGFGKSNYGKGDYKGGCKGMGLATEFKFSRFALALCVFLVAD